MSVLMRRGWKNFVLSWVRLPIDCFARIFEIVFVSCESLEFVIGYNAWCSGSHGWSLECVASWCICDGV